MISNKPVVLISGYRNVNEGNNEEQFTALLYVLSLCHFAFILAEIDWSITNLQQSYLKKLAKKETLLERD